MQITGVRIERGSSVIQVHCVPAGAIFLVENGRLKVRQAQFEMLDEPVGRPHVYITGYGHKIARCPQAKNVLFAAFEVACNPTKKVGTRKLVQLTNVVRRGVSPDLDQLYDAGDIHLHNELRRLAGGLIREGATTVWQVFRQETTYLRCDLPPTRLGAVVYCQVGMIGVQDVLIIEDERRWVT